MAIQSADDPSVKKQRYLKMADGENTKYDRITEPDEPHSRLSEAAMLREAFGRAKDLMSEQDEWCHMATSRSLHWSGVRSRYPMETMKGDQTLVDALRGDMRVNIHTYTTEDIEVGSSKYEPAISTDENVLDHAANCRGVQAGDQFIASCHRDVSDAGASGGFQTIDNCSLRLGVRIQAGKKSPVVCSQEADLTD